MGKGSIKKYILHDWNVICTKCQKIKSLTEYYIHSNGKHRKQCKNCVLENNKLNHLKYGNKYQLEYQKRNKDLCLFRSREWRKNNLKYDAYRSAKRRSNVQQQTPSWANLESIKQIYLNCPQGYEVDHIIPLKGLKASGLHIETNLQYLTPKQNRQKRNLYGWEAP